MVEEALHDSAAFEELYALMFDPDVKVAWRAAWACEKVCEQKPGYFISGKYNEITRLAVTSTHDGIQRGCLSMLLILPLPDELPVDLINSCFERMISPKSAIAVQALSMKMLYRFCLVEPAFVPEMLACLESVSPDDYSKGVNAARRNILKKLNAK